MTIDVGGIQMNKRGKQIDTNTTRSGIKLILISFLVLTIFIVLAINILAEPTDKDTIDDTWFDTHWGGDTGEESYREPAPPVIEEEPDPTSACSLYLPMIGVCLSAVGVWYAKKRREIKLE